MRTILGVLIVVLCACLPASAAKPNVLIVLVDDAGYGDFSCNGHPFLKTPNIDLLHSQSVRFTDFHVAPMCTPTRGQLLTGLDAVRNGATSVTGGRSFIRLGIPTMPEILGNAGYRTGIFGKWHLGDNYPHRAMDKGFQTAVWVKGWGFTSAPEFANTLFDGRCYRGDQEAKFKGYITDFCFDEAMGWMKERKEKAEPFFCYLPLHAAHAPCDVAEKYSAPFAEKAKGAAGFFGMLANIDENMGRLERFLIDSGLRDDTIVIFMTDNGGTAGVRFFNAGLRGHKTEYHEGGHRVPCFVRWPAGKLRPAGGIATPTQIQDLLPTLLDFTATPVPNGASFDGASLAPLIRGQTDRIADRMLVVQYSRAQLVKWECAVIWNQWRLVAGKELYDVQADREQKTDLAARHPDVVQKLRAHYEKWWAAMGTKPDEFVPVATVGSTSQPRVMLTSADWQDVYCDNNKHISQAVGGPKGGPWLVNVEKAGDYEIILRRWPAELNLPLNAGRDAVGRDPAGKALPIAAATVMIGSQVISERSADPKATEIVLRANLPAGVTRLQAWFRDDEGADLCGAFYADIKQK